MHLGDLTPINKTRCHTVTASIIQYTSFIYMLIQSTNIYRKKINNTDYQKHYLKIITFKNG